jgi:hypothetical protein
VKFNEQQNKPPALRRLKEMTMQNFDEMQKYGKDHLDSTVKAWNQVSKGVQGLAAETADYSKKFFEEGCAALEKLRGPNRSKQ